MSCYLSGLLVGTARFCLIRQLGLIQRLSRKAVPRGLRCDAGNDGSRDAQVCVAQGSMAQVRLKWCSRDAQASLAQVVLATGQALAKLCQGGLRYDAGNVAQAMLK